MSTEDGGAKAPVDALVMPDLRHIGTRRSGHNIAGFYANGGKAITFPQIWNSHHELADAFRSRNVVRQVKSLMEATP